MRPVMRISRTRAPTMNVCGINADSSILPNFFFLVHLRDCYKHVYIYLDSAVPREHDEDVRFAWAKNRRVCVCARAERRCKICKCNFIQSLVGQVTCRSQVRKSNWQERKQARQDECIWWVYIYWKRLSCICIECLFFLVLVSRAIYADKACNFCKQIGNTALVQILIVW